MSLAALVQAGAPSERAAEEVGGALARVLARDEFQPAGQDPLMRVLERILRSDVFDSLGDATGWTLLWIACLALGLLLGWAVVRAQRTLRRQRRAAGAPGLELPREGTPGVAARLAELRARAAAARARGDLVLALRLAFLALLVDLSQHGDLEFRDAWTHREMLERARPSSAARAALTPWLDELDAKLFGHGDVLDADLEKLDGLSARLLARGAGGAR